MERILVIDDDPSITRSLERSLSHEGFNVDAATSGQTGLAIARDNPPDVVILDLMMPGMDGYEVLRRLREIDQDIAVLMLTARDTPTDEALGFARGADDYVVKPYHWEVLIGRIRALLRRTRAEDKSRTLEFADLVLDTGLRQATRGAQTIRLTNTEYELLHELMRHPRQVLTREHLMDQIWGYELVGGTNVLDTYVKQLRQKTESGGKPRLIHTVRYVGYVLRED